MNARQMVKRVGNQKKNENAVEVLLRGVRKDHTDPDLLNEIPLRLTEIRSLIRVVHAALEADLYDESFYREHVGSTMYLFEERFDDLQKMVKTIIDEKWKHNQKLRTGA